MGAFKAPLMHVQPTVVLSLAVLAHIPKNVSPHYPGGSPNPPEPVVRGLWEFAKGGGKLLTSEPLLVA